MRYLLFFCLVFWISCNQPKHHEAEKLITKLIENPNLVDDSFLKSRANMQDDSIRLPRDAWIKYFQSYNGRYVVFWQRRYLQKYYYSEMIDTAGHLFCDMKIFREDEAYGMNCTFLKDTSGWTYYEIRFTHY